MMVRRLALAFSLLLAAAAPALSQKPAEKEGEEQGEDVRGRMEWERFRRTFPFGQIPAGARLEALGRLDQLSREREPLVPGALPGTWEPIGPAPIDKGQVDHEGPDRDPTKSYEKAREMSGRVIAIAVNPSKPQHWVVGTAGGGIWQTTTSGSAWFTNTDNAPSLAIGAVAFDPKTPTTIYAGTGEAEFGGHSYLGAGLLKSTDEGQTWTQLQATYFEGSAFSAIRVNPDQPSNLLATIAGGANRGIVRSTNGGERWDRVQSGTGTDLIVHPTRPTYAYAGLGHTEGDSGNGVYRSSIGIADPLSTWTRIRGPWSDFQGRIGRIALAIAPSKPDRLYVSIQDVNTIQQLLGLWYTDNAWESDATKVLWKEIDTSATDGVDDTTTPPTPLKGFCRKQCYYDMEILVDLVDPDLLYAGGIGLWSCSGCTKTNAAGASAPTWKTIGTNRDPTKAIHVDQHALVQVPVSTQSSNTATFKHYRTDYQWCGGPNWGTGIPGVPPGGRTVADRAENPLSYEFVRPSCDPYFGTFTGAAATITVDPTTVTRATPKPDNPQFELILDPPIRVTLSTGLFAEAPASGASAAFLQASLPNDFQGMECEKRDYKYNLQPRQGGAYSASIGCTINELRRSPSDPVGEWDAAASVRLNFDTRPVGSSGVSPIFFFCDVVFEIKPPTRLFAGNDGGVFSTTDGGSSWADHNTNLAITQFYKGSMHPTSGDHALGGSQDNGTERWTGSNRWQLVVGGDGGATAFSTANPRHQAVTVWGNKRITRTLDGGDTDFENVHDGLDTKNLPFAIPLAKCPKNDNVFLTGTTKVYRSDNFFLDDPLLDPSWTLQPGHTFTYSIGAFAFPPSSPDCNTYVAAAANELKRTTNGGTVWDPLPEPSALAVSDLEFDPTNANVLWVSYSGFSQGLRKSGQLYRTANALAPAASVTWADRTPAGLNLPINTVLVDPVNRGIIYIGTDVGVLRSLDEGANWTRMDPASGMPNVPVYDIQRSPTGTIVAFTHGRGAFRLVLGKADLAVTKVPRAPTVTVGQPAEFLLTVRNNGPDGASSVVVTDTLPADVDFVSATPSPGVTCEGTGPVLCRIAGLPNGASATVTIKVTTKKVGIITNQADITGDVSDPDPANSAAFANVTVVASGGSDRAITKGHSPEPVALGGVITYTLTVRNNGPETATEVVVTDTLPASVTFLSATASQGGCGGGAVVTCSLGTLASGASATVTITGTATQAGTITNTAVVTGKEADPNAGNDSATDTATVNGALAITRLTPPSARQGTRNLDLKIEGVGFVPQTVVSFQPSTGIEIVPPTGPNFGFVGPTEIHRVIHLAADAPAGERQVFVTNPGGQSGGLRPFNVFTVTPAALPAIELSPAAVDFGTVAAKQTAQRTIAVRNTGTAPLTVRALGINGSSMLIVSPAAPFDVPPGGQTTVTLRFAPQIAGSYPRTLVISSNDPARPSVTASLTGVGTAALAPKAELTPAALNFGKVVRGQTRSLTVRLRNPGNATLNVTSITSNSVSYTTGLALPATLAAGAEVSFPVTFSATANGFLPASLTISSNDPSASALGFEVRGQGTDPASTETLITDDGTIESGFNIDGLVMVNRVTPSRYPARLDRISIHFYPFQNFPNPSGKSIRLIAYADPSGAAASSQRPQLLVSQPVTIPSVPAIGGFLDFDVANPPSIESGDFYVGFAAPNPASGVIFSLDTNGTPRQRGYYSLDGGITFSGPVEIQEAGQPNKPTNVMIRATTSSGGAASACTWGIAPAKIEVPKEGGSGTLNVSAPAGCTWNVTSDSPFISFGGSRAPLVAGTGNGSVSFTAAPYTGSSARTATITAAELSASVGQSVPPPDSSGFSSDVFVPIVLSNAGLAGAFFSSELTLTNRGSTSAVLESRYTPAFGGGGGSAFDVLPPGAQRVYPDGLAYLKSIGTPIPDSGNRGGTVNLSFTGLSTPSAGAATVRTASNVPEGRAGLAYSGVPSNLAHTGTVYLLGLRQNTTDRSNVAVMNAGSSGDTVLRLTIFSGDPAIPISATLPDIALPPGVFSQISGILQANGLLLTNGYVRVERVAGTAPFYAYGVINDQANSDGSFVPPVTAESLAGRTSLTLPVVVETATFLSELVVTNFGSSRKTVRLSLVADAVAAPNNTATFTLDLSPSQQTIIPNLFQYLRERGTPGIGAAGSTTVGPVFVGVDGGDVSGIFVGARTSSAGGGGRYGLFYTGVPNGGGARQSAWLFGLLQDADNRSNLALVNTGETDTSTDVFSLDIYDGDTGTLVNTVGGVTLGPRRFTQITTLLALHAPGVRNGYVKVTKTSGNNPFVAYVVVNDGGQPGQRTGDGAFLPMTSVDQ